MCTSYSSEVPYSHKQACKSRYISKTHQFLHNIFNRNIDGSHEILPLIKKKIQSPVYGNGSLVPGYLCKGYGDMFAH